MGSLKNATLQNSLQKCPRNRFSVSITVRISATEPIGTSTRLWIRRFPAKRQNGRRKLYDSRQLVNSLRRVGNTRCVRSNRKRNQHDLLYRHTDRFPRLLNRKLGGPG